MTLVREASSDGQSMRRRPWARPEEEALFHGLADLVVLSVLRPCPRGAAQTRGFASSSAREALVGILDWPWNFPVYIMAQPRQAASLVPRTYNI